MGDIVFDLTTRDTIHVVGEVRHKKYKNMVIGVLDPNVVNGHIAKAKLIGKQVDSFSFKDYEDVEMHIIGDNIYLYAPNNLYDNLIISYDMSPANLDRNSLLRGICAESIKFVNAKFTNLSSGTKYRASL